MRDLHAPYESKVRVYAEDVDFMGIVYHANYLRYLERARSDMLRDNGMILSDLIMQDVLFAINELTIKYIIPAKLDDLLIITTRIKEITACSLLFEQEIINPKKKLICAANILVVCVNGNLRPKCLPNQIRNK